MRLTTLFTATVVAASFSLTACESTAVKSTETTNTKAAAEAPAVKETANTSIEVFEVDHDGRINVFYDYATYTEFKKLGETSYRLTRIGAGPNGQTVVFGLPKADKKKGDKTPAAMWWDGKFEPSEFYGQMDKHGRIYVFDSAKEMEHVRTLGHPSYMYTQIGSGPKGETVVYVLTKENKKKKPVDMIAKFESINK